MSFVINELAKYCGIAGMTMSNQRLLRETESRLNMSINLRPDGSTAVSSFSKTELFAQTFATNSILWMILGIFLLLLHPLTTSSLKSKFFIMTFSMPLLALIFGRLTIRMKSLLFSKTVLPNFFRFWRR